MSSISPIIGRGDAVASADTGAEGVAVDATACGESGVDVAVFSDVLQSEASPLGPGDATDGSPLSSTPIPLGAHKRAPGRDGDAAATSDSVSLVPSMPSMVTPLAPWLSLIPPPAITDRAPNGSIRADGEARRHNVEGHVTLTPQHVETSVLLDRHAPDLMGLLGADNNGGVSVTVLAPDGRHVGAHTTAGAPASTVGGAPAGFSQGLTGGGGGQSSPMGQGAGSPWTGAGAEVAENAPRAATVSSAGIERSPVRPSRFGGLSGVTRIDIQI